MKTLAIAAAALLVALPAAAQQVPGGAAGAIAHFNQSKVNSEEVVLVAGKDVGLSSRSGASEAQARFNATYDSTDDIRRTSGATVVGGQVSRSQEIFARIRAESAMDE